MRIAVISDLHLGPDTVDQFWHDETEFVRFLKFLEDNFERIILLGDVYEALMSVHLGDTKSGLIQCMSSHKEIVKRFDSKQYTYIHGNHDWIAAKHLSAPDELRIEANNQRIVFRHGHQYDSLIKKARWFSEFSVWFGGWLIRMGFWPLYQFIAAKGENPAAEFLQKLEELIIDSCPKADIIVTGHTHVPKKRVFKNKLYLNSGTCSNGRYSFLSIDTATGTYEMHDKW